MTDRLTRLRTAIANSELDAILISNAHNRRYLTGFTGSAGWVLVSSDAAWLATDFRYWEQAERQASSFTLYQQEAGIAEWLPGFVAPFGGKKIGFEAADVSVAMHKQLREIIGGMSAAQRPALVQTEGMLENLRAIKDTEEIVALEQAVQLGDAAFQYVASLMEPGWTEERTAWEIERYAREHSAEGMSFSTIVGSGPWSAMPHCHPREESIVAGVPIVIDMGVILNGYCSDLTRTIVLGDPDDEFKHIYDIVLTAQETAEATIESGMTGEAAHMIAHNVIAEAGYGDRFGHGLGHGVGLEIHEKPRVGRTSSDLLEDGMIVTVEPGIYLPGWGGVRIEDMGVIENGKFRNFTTAPKLRMVGA